jgi:hypothetical protein
VFPLHARTSLPSQLLRRWPEMSEVLLRWTRTTMAMRRLAREGWGSVQSSCHPLRTRIRVRLNANDAPVHLDDQYVYHTCSIAPELLTIFSGVLWSLLEDWAARMRSPDWQEEVGTGMCQLCPEEGQLQTHCRSGTQKRGAEGTGGNSEAKDCSEAVYCWCVTNPIPLLC